MAEQVPEDVARNFAEVSDRLRRGGVPAVQLTDSDPELLAKLAARMEQVELAIRPSSFVWTRAGSTAGIGADYAAADTWDLPFESREIIIALIDPAEGVALLTGNELAPVAPASSYGAYVQIANSARDKWQNEEILISGAARESLRIKCTSIRIRAYSTTQALYRITALGA